MRHNQQNREFAFYREPVEFSKATDKRLLQYCLGGTLYMPGTKDITDKLLKRQLPMLTSMVMCFEDAIQESQLEAAERNVLSLLDTLAGAFGTGSARVEDIPLIFLRVRHPEQFAAFAARLTKEQADVLSGFVFPKFCSQNGYEYLTTLGGLNRSLAVSLYGMPILEGKTIAYIETRLTELTEIRGLLKPFRDLILNVRIGGTDFSSIFGVRRGINSSIYDILPVRDCLSDILNFFNREGEDYTVSAPVWEFFLADREKNLELLRTEDLHESLLKRNTIINEAVDGLLREVILDKANGMVGKTAIHPSHLKYVNAMQAVTREEYEDATQILSASGGVIKSAKANKMNEINPHRNWAEKVANRAQAYGVISDESEYIRMFVGGSGIQE